jgi:hypothetical protein
MIGKNGGYLDQGVPLDRSSQAFLRSRTPELLPLTRQTAGLPAIK